MGHPINQKYPKTPSYDKIFTMKTLTPVGVDDFLPAEAEKHQNIISTISNTFESFKFEKIRTPTIEYFDTLSVGMGDHLQKQAIKFFDNSGNILVLRPDHTTPIARLAATHLKNKPLPLKLYYLNSIFRNQPPESHQDMEIFQGGLELIGEAGPKAEATVIRILIESLKALGFSDIIVDIGHTKFAEGLSDAKKTALLAGNYIEYGEIPARGGPELVENIPDLKEVYNELKSQNLDSYVRFNKGMVKELKYYSGIIFEAYIDGIRGVVGSGGRYDNLLEKFGFNCPAVGFALNVNLIQGSQVK